LKPRPESTPVETPTSGLHGNPYTQMSVYDSGSSRLQVGGVDPRSWHGDLRKTLIGMVKSTLGIRE